MKKQTFFAVSERSGENVLFCKILWCLFNLHLRKAIVQYRMFHQVRFDGGKELYLSLFIQKQYPKCKPCCTVRTDAVKASQYV